jgi:hypothetical protein
VPTAVRVSSEAVERVAALLRRGPLPEPEAWTYSPRTPWFPPRGAAFAVPFFFASVLHLYGLWEEDGRRFRGPVRGHVDGREWTGDAFLWKALWRTVQEEPRFVLASYQAELTVGTLSRLWRDDSGGCPVPMLESHVELARGYGRALEEQHLTPNKLLESCRAAAEPAQELVRSLSDVPGYREDPFRRKAFLLGLILSARPEGFLPPAAAWPPVADRHHLRLALRWGAVDVDDPAARDALSRGETVPPPVEQAVRAAAYEAFRRALDLSGRSVPETHALFSAARDYCPETAPPDCGRCFFSEACGRRTTMFPPAVRTLSY